MGREGGEKVLHGVFNSDTQWRHLTLLFFRGVSVEKKKKQNHNTKFAENIHLVFSRSHSAPSQLTVVFVGIPFVYFVYFLQYQCFGAGNVEKGF